MIDGREEERLWKALVTDRLGGLLEDMGWTEKDFAGQIHDIAGVQEKAVIQWFRRQSIPAHKLTVIARFLGIDIRYLMLDSQVDSPSPAPRGTYARERELTELRRRLAEKEGAQANKSA